MAFPLDRSTYVKVGAEKGLEFVDEIAPATVYDKCNWRCTECGLPYYKTYRAVYLGKYGCRCQNGMSIPIERYKELETKFNIKLLAKSNNFMQPSKWYSPVTGNTVEMSYYQMVNAPLKNVELFKLLGVTIEVPVRKPILNEGVSRKGKVHFEVNGKKLPVPASMLTPDSTDKDRERVMKKAEKLKKKGLTVQSHYRLLNQEEEQGIVEVYDN